MNFGEAIQAMKDGKLITRKGWNGKNMYLWYMPPATIKAEWCKEPHLKALADENGGEIECMGAVRMKTADNKVVTGWVASQADMFAEDWEIYNNGNDGMDEYYSVSDDEKLEADDWNYRKIRFFRADVSPISFEDGEVNGECDDEDEPRIPCVNEDFRWNILIDIKTGKVLNWVDGVYADVYYKVVDDGIYTAYDNNMHIVKKIEDYVPKLMDFDDRDGSFGFGDYMGLIINENGYIENWPSGEDLEFFIDDFLKGNE